MVVLIAVHMVWIWKPMEWLGGCHGVGLSGGGGSGVGTHVRFVSAQMEVWNTSSTSSRSLRSPVPLPHYYNSRDRPTWGNSMCVYCVHVCLCTIRVRLRQSKLTVETVSRAGIWTFLFPPFKNKKRIFHWQMVFFCMLELPAPQTIMKISSLWISTLSNKPAKS